jgi:purine-nucleoside phosphorylase
VAVVLGSGLSDIANRVQVHRTIEYFQLDGWPRTTVKGHQGRLLLGTWSGIGVAVFSGRLHYYEGHEWEQVLAPVRLAASLGARHLLLTNAAGGIRDDLVPGTLMSIAAHLDWTCANVDSNCQTKHSCPYSPRLRSLLGDAAKSLGSDLADGTYAAVLGPNYETPAEIRALRALGADAVGMSTAREVEAAHQLGLECAAISCITNRAAGLTGARLTHDEVLANSRKQAARLGDLIERFLSLAER